MTLPARSGCPLNLTMEVLGGRWNLVIPRDMRFGNRRHFRDLLANSMEVIASNILAARLRHLQEQELASRRDDPARKRKVIYSLTETAIDLVPAIVALGAWGRRHLPVAPELSVHSRLLAEGGPAMQERLMGELRRLHLGDGDGAEPMDPAGSVLAGLNAAYQAHLAEAAKAQGLTARGCGLAGWVTSRSRTGGVIGVPSVGHRLLFSAACQELPRPRRAGPCSSVSAWSGPPPGARSTPP